MSPRLGHTYNIEAENRLREFRVDANISQVDLGKVCGIYAVAIYSLENGLTKIAHYRTGDIKPWIIKCCDFLGRDIGEVFPREICDIRKNDLTDVQILEITMGQELEEASNDFDICSFLEKLQTREHLVLLMRCFESKTLEEVGDYFNITRERVRQIEARALRKLKRMTEIANRKS